MTDPEEPALYAHPDDVADRYVEGTFPSTKTAWAQLRIEDVESILIGEVPDLASTVGIDDARLRRVRTLVADKVLDLYRNPEGKSASTSTMEGLTETYQFRGSRSNEAITFTEAELNRVRPKRRARRQLGSYGVAPWGIPR